MSEAELLELELGERLRSLRADRRLALEDLAARSGVSAEDLSAFEQGRATPGIGELAKLASALGVSIGHFFQRGIPERRVELVRSQERWTLQPHTETGRTLNYRYQALSYHLTDKLMAPFMVEIPPDDSSDVPSSTHDGEEFLFVLSGQLRVTIDDEEHQLGPGDSIYYDSRIPHSLRAAEGMLVRLIACIAQGPQRSGEDSLGRAFERSHGLRYR